MHALLQLMSLFSYFQKPPEVPPPLNPALVPKDLDRSDVVTNGLGSEGEAVMFMPPQEDKTSRKAVMLPRTHVYETVPDDIAQVRLMQFSFLLAAACISW